MEVKKEIDAVIYNAELNIKAEQGDYIGDDGLLMCGRCNTPKQCRVFILGEECTPMCLCKCQAERRDKEETERKLADRVRKLRKLGLPDADMQAWTFANDDGKNKKVMGILQNYVEHFGEMHDSGKGLLLFGGVGTGKTYGAVCVANALISRGTSCLVTNFARLVNTIQGLYDGKQAYIDGLNRFSLLIIDDLASERDTDYMNEVVYNIIDSRCRAGLPLIITTNLTAEELKRPSDLRKQRIYSRIMKMCIPVKVDGADRRREMLRDDWEKYKDILGVE